MLSHYHLFCHPFGGNNTLRVPGSTGSLEKPGSGLHIHRMEEGKGECMLTESLIALQLDHAGRLV